MKEIWQTRWQQLAPRERRVISWGGSALLAALLYAYLWQPLNTERHKLRASLPQLRASATAMALQTQEAARLRQNTGVTPSGPSLQAAIEQAASESGADKNTMQITLLDANRANINFQKISFDNWTALAARLQGEKHVRLDSCGIAALAETGAVRVQAVVVTGAR